MIGSVSGNSFGDALLRDLLSASPRPGLPAACGTMLPAGAGCCPLKDIQKRNLDRRKPGSSRHAHAAARVRRGRDPPGVYEGRTTGTRDSALSCATKTRACERPRRDRREVPARPRGLHLLAEIRASATAARLKRRRARDRGARRPPVRSQRDGLPRALWSQGGVVIWRNSGHR